MSSDATAESIPDPQGHQSGIESASPPAADEQPPPLAAESESVAENPAESQEPRSVTPGPEPQSDSVDHKERSQHGGGKHVVFSPEVKVADIIFERPPTKAELEAELDVFERLYRKSRSVKAAQTSNAVAETTTTTTAEEGGIAGAAEESNAVVQPQVSAPAAAAQPTPPVADKELAECTFKPKITEIAKQQRKLGNWGEFVKLQTDWVRLTKRKTEEAAKRVNIEEGIGQPLYEDINRKLSVKLIAYMEKQHLYKPPHERSTFTNQQKSKSPLAPVRKSASRSTSGSDDSAPRRRVVDKEIFNRLYNDAVIHDAALRVMEQTQIEKEARELFRPSTNESYWHSGTMLGARTPLRRKDTSDFGDSVLTSQRDVVEELLAKGDEYKIRREQRLVEKIHNPDVYTFKPETNPNSKRIILERAMQRELEMAEMEAAEEAAREARSRESMNVDGCEISPHKAKPKVVFDADVFTARMQRKEIEKAQRLAALRRAMKIEEVSGCTFRPSISKKSHDSAERMRSAQTYATKSSPSIRRTSDHRDPNAFAESYSPEEKSSSRRAHAAEEATRPAPSHAPLPAHVARVRVTNGGTQQRAAKAAPSASREAAATRGVAHRETLDQGEEYLRNLEDELRGVIAEWTTITATAA